MGFLRRLATVLQPFTLDPASRSPWTMSNPNNKKKSSVVAENVYTHRLRAVHVMSDSVLLLALPTAAPPPSAPSAIIQPLLEGAESLQ
jgi:hypothetical protein